MTAWPEDRHDTEDEGIPPGSALLSRARARVCAVDFKPGEAAGGVPSLPSAYARARVTVLAWQAKAQTACAKAGEHPGTLLHAQPPTFHQAHVRHRECAGHYGHPVARMPRLAYGYVHLVFVKAPLNYAEWATDSPLRGTVHVLLGLAVWLGLLLGGYL